jgi:DNA modification methylase
MSLAHYTLVSTRSWATNSRNQRVRLSAKADQLDHEISKDFMGDHEWCFYGWKEGAAHRFFGPPNVSDVWSLKKLNPQTMLHLTEKPTELAVRAMQYSSRVGETVLDLFGGSGSTLIAAEQMGRRAYLMEIDPAYVDVIVQRYEAFSGCKGVHRPASACITTDRDNG